MKHTLVIFEVEGADAAKDRFTFSAQDTSLTVVAIPSSDLLGRIVKEVMDISPVTHIELCGGMGFSWPARLRSAVPTLRSVHIGAISYGFESLDSVHWYKEAYTRGESLREVFFFVVPGIKTTRVDLTHGLVSTSLIALDSSRLKGVSQELKDERIHLIELYGDVSAEDIATVLKNTGNGEIPVGVPTYSKNTLEKI